MKGSNNQTVAGLYDDVNDARQAIQELLDRGFDQNQISLMTRSRERTVSAGGMAEAEPETSVQEGAGLGAILGGTAGLLVGLGALAIPGIGPVVAAGALAAAILGAGAGAAAGGLIGALVGAGIPREEAGYYAEGVRRGGTLIAVNAPPNRIDEATAVLRRYRPVDLLHRAEEWRRQGWTGFEENISPYRERELTTDVGAGSGRNRDYDTFESEFRRHYQNTYGQTGRAYADYEVGYRYGYDLANAPDYRGWDWPDIQDRVRQDWERGHRGDWEEYRRAIQEGWNAGSSVYRGEGVGRREEAVSPRRVPGREEQGGSGSPLGPGGGLPWDEQDREEEGQGTGGTGTSGRGEYTGRDTESKEKHKIREAALRGGERPARTGPAGPAARGEADAEGAEDVVETGRRQAVERGEEEVPAGPVRGGEEPKERTAPQAMGTTGRMSYRGADPFARDTTGGGMGGGDWDRGPSEAGGRSRVVDDYSETPPITEYTRYEAGWRRHYQNTYGQAGGTFEDYELGYRFGYDLAHEPRLQNRAWDEIEKEARSEWAQRGEGSWENFYEAIREGWTAVRGQEE